MALSKPCNLALHDQPVPDRINEPLKETPPTDTPVADRYKPGMPQVPGLDGRIPDIPKPSVMPLVIAAVAVLLVIFVVTRWIMRPKPVYNASSAVLPQIEVPTAAPDPNALMPHSTSGDPVIANVSEMAKPWSSKDFFFRDRLTGEDIPAVLIRLPGGSTSNPSGYWAISKKAVYGKCQLEYVADIAKLKNEYGYRASHPMIGNPCTSTLVDPLKMTNLPGNIFVRGAVVQGADLRPPLNIEIQIQAKSILATRME